MNVAAVMGIAVAAIAVLAFVVDRIVRPTRRNARAVAEFLEDWRGTPERREGDVILVPHRPGVLERLAVGDERFVRIEHLVESIDQRSAQLERNGGAHLADAVHRIEEMVQANRRSLEHQMVELVRQVVEARQIAGEAAVVTARAEEAHVRDHGQLVQILEEMRDRIWERFLEQDRRFDEQHLRELTYIAMLHELGIDLELPNPLPPPEDDPHD